jgi:cysteinyl-tRNA synthetase
MVPMRTSTSFATCLAATLYVGLATSLIGGSAGCCTAPDPGSAGGTPGRGFPAASPWVSFYGPADEMGDLALVASRFRVINIDADPSVGNFTQAQILALQTGGMNRVLSYFNLGSCERFRGYWAEVPRGFVSCEANKAAQRGTYDGFPDEVWMDVGNADYQRLLVEYVAPQLVAQGVDGFYFDNLEIVEHGTATKNGPCNANCAQGGLDLVRRLRERFPNLLFVMQNATSEVTRHGRTGGVEFPSLLDGISHEEVYAPVVDGSVQAELLAWASLGLLPNGRTFWIGTEDYVGSCGAGTAARTAYEHSRAHGFSPYVTDQSGGQGVICYWPF